jgi:outer membrane protein assembly factor BamB
MKQTLFTTLVLLACTTALAGDWMQWRGPNFNGTSDATGLPDTWSLAKKENTEWITNLDGGSATPVITGDRIFLPTTSADDHLKAVCLSRKTGKILWEESMGTGRRAMSNASMSAPSAATDGELVVFMFGQGTLAGMNTDGKLLWKRELEEEENIFSQNFGYGSTPLLHNGIAYIAVLRRIDRLPKGLTANDKPMDSFVMAVDAKTGKTIWRVNRDTQAIGESRDGYSTPLLSPEGLIVTGGDLVTCYNLKTGNEEWRNDYSPKKRQKAWRIVASPFMADDLIVTSLPRGRTLMALDKNGKEKWTYEGFIPDVCCPAYKDGLIYALDGNKRYLSCIDAKTGEQVWEQKLESAKGFYASPLLADGKIYLINFDGEVFVWNQGRSTEQIAHFNVDNETWPAKVVCDASLIAVDDCIFVRTPTKLACVKK